jgi:hypothetical protein
VTNQTVDPWFVDLPPTSRQKWSAVIFAASAGFGVTAPFAGTQLSRVSAFIPTFEAAVFRPRLYHLGFTFRPFFSLPLSCTSGTSEWLPLYRADSNSACTYISRRVFDNWIIECWCSEHDSPLFLLALWFLRGFACIRVANKQNRPET